MVWIYCGNTKQQPKITHLACCNANWPLICRNQKGAKPSTLDLIQGPFGTFSDLEREHRRYSLQSYIKFISFGRFSWQNR